MPIKRNSDGTASVSRGAQGTGGKIQNKNPMAIKVPKSARDTTGVSNKKPVPRTRKGK